MKPKIKTDREQSMVQRNLFTSLGFMLIAYFVFVVAVYFSGGIISKGMLDPWVAVEVGALMAVLAVIPHYFGRKHKGLYAVSLVMNVAGAGLSASALVKEILPELSELISYSAPSLIFTLVIGSLLFILTCLSEDPRAYGAVAAIVLGVIFAIVMLVLWIRNGGFLHGFGFFLSVLTAFLIGSLALSLDEERFIAPKYVSRGSFGGFLIILIVVIAVLSEGEILEALDIDLPDFGGRKNKTLKK